MAIKSTPNAKNFHTSAMNEIEILEKLTKLNHKNLVNLLSFKETLKEIYMVMEVRKNSVI